MAQLNRRQLLSSLTLFGTGSLPPARLASSLLAPRQATPRVVQIAFHPAPNDIPLGFYNAHLFDIMEWLKRYSFSFYAPLVAHPRFQGCRIFAGHCLLTTRSLETEHIAPVAVFPMNLPGRRVRVSIGGDHEDFNDPEQAFELPVRFARHFPAATAQAG